MNIMATDLGTYHLRVELVNGDGFITTWETGRRYTDCNLGCSPLTAQAIEPYWEDEASVFQSMRYNHLEGNFSCDCNKRLMLARSRHEQENEDDECGDMLATKRLTAIRPDGTEHVLYEA